MVKTLISIAIGLLLLFGAAIGEHIFVNDRFDTLTQSVETLQTKIRKETATRNDAEAVRALWNSEKKKLHVVVPHNDISYIDYWLGETVGCIETKDYKDALSKAEVLVTICRQIPKTYSISFENVF